MKLLFDTSVWIEHLRRDTLSTLLPVLRGKYQLWMDAIVAAELLAGCRSRSERRVIDALITPFSRANRLRTASATDLEDAGRVLSRLKERGISLKGAAGALLDAAIAVGCVRGGALLVSENARDFDKLASVLPLRHSTFSVFRSAT